MKKVMKFVKGNKKEEETPVKNVSVETKKVLNEKVDDTPREDDFISRDKSITKLHKAVWNENSDKLKSIIKTHDIDITDKLDRTALYFAVLKNNPNIVNLLLENSANQNIPDIDGITPFLKSVQLGYKQCAATLLSYGADIKKTDDKDSNSCLHFAVMGKQNDMISFLLEHNADSNIPNVNGEYPLHIAIQIQDIQIVELLLNHNADINVVNNSGLTPLMIAEQQNNFEIVELLENYSLKNSKDNNLFPDEISHKSSYENVNTPKIDHAPKLESDAETWNDSPITTPSKKQNKPLTKISKFFNDEIEITEEKSESDVSVKCSENTSPQSGIIPPPCKPLRSLEYLQSGMAMENRTVHLLTLGTVRTRHISMTESDHSKNTTPHRYSYQGDLQNASGESFQKLPADHFSADEKGDSVNISVKSKILSKLECDSTIQSDWGSNESLPLDELSIGGKKEKSITSSTSKNNSNNSNSGSVKDKSTDTFLQKQFSLLEDYEKNREKRCSVSYEMDLLTVKLDKTKDNSDSHLDDIDNLLEDNNRINTQLEKYVGQTDTPVGTTKSKSLPRNCEPYSYHKGSFSLPRTLEGKDPYRDVRSYSYFKPRSHFSFSLKMLRGDKKSGFLDKLRSMFNKKSQIHLTEHNDNGTWLYTKTDNEHLSPVDSSISGSENLKKGEGDNMSSSKTFDNFNSYLEFTPIDHTNLFNNEQNKVIENKILSLNNMSRESSHSGIYPSCSSDQKSANIECSYTEDDPQIKYKKTGPRSSVETIFCDECSDFMNQKLTEAEQNILSKENFIHLLQEQLEQLKDRNIKSINATQEVYYKYGVAQQELLNLKHICAKYDDEIQKLRMQKSQGSSQDKVASKLKEEAEKWKKQYEDLEMKVNLEASTSKSEEKWRSIIQDEVQAAVNILKENSQVVVSSLEKQNKKLENIVEKLQNDLEVGQAREDTLQNELQAMTNKLVEASLQCEQIRCNYDEEYESNMKTFVLNNEKLKADLEKMTQLYTDLQQNYTESVKKIENNVKKYDEMNEEFIIIKDEYRSLTKSLTKFSEEIVKAKENALLKNEELRLQVAEMGPSSNMKQFVNKITAALENIEMTCDCTPDSFNDSSEQVIELNNSIADVEKINKLNFEIELKLLEVRTSKLVGSFEEENKQLKENMAEKCDNLLMKVKESVEEIEIINAELKSKNDVIQNQNMQISNLNDIIDNEKQKNDMLECEITCARNQIQKERSSLTQLAQENEELKDRLETSIKDRKSIEEENIIIKSSLTEINTINKDLNKKLQEGKITISEMKALIDESQNKMKKLEEANEELKQTVESLKNAADDSKAKEYIEKINNFDEENRSLKEQLNLAKENISSLNKHINSLQFYHENQMKANNVRIHEIQAENNTNKINLISEIEKITNRNVVLEKKLETIGEENKQLQNNIDELNTEINALHEKLQNTEILQDSQKYINALAAMNEENIEMKTAVNVLREILEVKLGEKVNSVSDLLEAASNEKQIAEVNLADNENTDNKIRICKEICDGNKSIIQRVNSIEKKIDELVDNVSIDAEEIKSISMPNLDDPELEKQEPEDTIEISAKSESNNVLRKSSSLDSIVEKLDKDCCEVKWEKHLESMHILRTELTTILGKIDDKKEEPILPTESMTKKCTDKYKQIIISLQKQINELQQKSAQESRKNDGLQEQMTEMNGQICQKSRTELDEEVYRLRKELFKQKVERIKDKEVAKIKREAEIFAIQQQLKLQFLENKQRLLSDLAAVQSALQVKREEKFKIKNKCDDLLKEITASKDKKKKTQDISHLTTQPLSRCVQNVVIYEVPDASRQDCIPQCSKYPEKPVKPHALVINARKKLNTLEKHRLSESVPEQSSSDEELKKKYLLQ